MEIVVLPKKTEKIGLKFDNMLEKLNTRIMEKVGECNNILDKIQLSSQQELDRRKAYELSKEKRIKSNKFKVTELNQQLIAGTNGNYRFVNIDISDKHIQCELAGPVVRMLNPHPLCNGYGRRLHFINASEDIHTLRTIARDLIDEYNERKSGTGDRELSKDDSEVSE